MQEASLTVRDRNRLEMLEIAERLFADAGVEAVSLRQIGTESGRRTPATVQYHFGSKADLLRAILDHRLPALTAHRLDLMLDHFRARGRDVDLRALVQTMVRPLVERPPEARHFVRFLARLAALRGALRTELAADLDTTLHTRLVTEDIVTVLDHLPAALRRPRISMATSLMVHEIADYEELVAAGREPVPTRRAFAGDLVDAMVGLLAAPHTPVEDR